MSTFISYNQFSEITSVERRAQAGFDLSSQSYNYDPLGNMLSSVDANGGISNFTYNGAGLPTSRADANGNSYTYRYDSLNRPIQEIDPLTDPTWTYDDAGNMTSSTNANGATTTYTYDAMGRTLTETLPIDATTSATYSFSYDAAGNLASKTIPLYYSAGTLVTASYTYTYNGMNQLLTTTDPLGNVTTDSYDAAGNLIGVTDPLGNTTSYGYDADGRKVSESVPISGSGASQVNALTSYTLDPAGQVAAMTNPLNQTTQYTYNPRGWASSITDPLGNQVLYTYYDTGAVRDKTLQSVSGASETSSYYYDRNGNLVGSWDPSRNSTWYTYDANNNVLSVTGANKGQGNVTYTYDAQNRRATSTDAEGDIIQYSYDAVGNLIHETDPLGNVTTYTYDEQNRLLSVTNPLSGTTTTTYNLAGWKTSVTDPVGNTTRYSYNADGWLIGETNPLGYSSSYTYNAAGEEIGYTDYVGNQTQYSYNEAGWRTGETWLNNQNQVAFQATYTYDNAGELIAASDNFSAFAYSYDVAGNRTQQAVTYSRLSMQPLVTLNYAYDGIGHRTSFSDSLGGEIDYLYSGGQMDRIELSLNGQLTPIQENILHDDKGLLARVINPDGTDALTVSHDAAGRVTEMNYGASGLDLTYAYNAGGEVTSYTGPEGTINYNYDTTGQLTGSTGAQTAGFAYDANGNRTMTGYQTGPDNELLSDGTYTYTYNQNGQLATKSDSAGNVWTYTWDNRGRMVEVSETGSQSQVLMDEKLIYDVHDNLIGTMVNGTLQRWTVWDGKNPYLEFDGTGNVTERYVTNPDTLNAFYGQVSASGQTEFYLTDQQGSIRRIVDASGNVLDQISYDAYGKIVSQTNASNASLYLFQGGALDANLGLYHFGARWYDSNGGRWICQDPMSFAAGDSNLYRYVGNGPTNATDATGYQIMPFGGSVTGREQLNEPIIDGLTFWWNRPPFPTYPPNDPRNSPAMWILWQFGYEGPPPIRVVRMPLTFGDMSMMAACSNLNPPLRAALTTAERTALRRAARDIWELRMGRRAIWDNLDVHHRIPGQSHHCSLIPSEL